MNLLQRIDTLLELEIVRRELGLCESFDQPGAVSQPQDVLFHQRYRVSHLSSAEFDWQRV